MVKLTRDGNMGENEPELVNLGGESEKKVRGIDIGHL